MTQLCCGPRFAAGLAGPDDAGSNAEVQYPDAGGTFTMLAKRHIRKGEEVTLVPLGCPAVIHAHVRTGARSQKPL